MFRRIRLGPAKAAAKVVMKRLFDFARRNSAIDFFGRTHDDGDAAPNGFTKPAGQARGREWDLGRIAIAEGADVYGTGTNSMSAKRVLEPIDRVSEVLFGLIMVLTFTGSLSVAEAGRDDVRAMLVGALGCNLAWGIIDAILYLMGCLAEKGRGLFAFHAARRTADPTEAQRLIADAVPAAIASVLTPAELEAVRQRLIQLPEPPPRAQLSKEDWLGAGGVFLLVFLCTFPVVIPFLLMSHAGPALRVSNLVAIVMLFATGYAFGRMTARNPWLVGLVMVVLGLILVGMTMALGG